MIRKFKFPKYVLVTPIKIYQTELSEDEGEIENIIFDGKCYYEEKTKQILDKERKLITLAGKVILEGDINPNNLIDGYIEVNSIKKNIYNVERFRNPDGSVCLTILELI